MLIFPGSLIRIGLVLVFGYLIIPAFVWSLSMNLYDSVYSLSRDIAYTATTPEFIAIYVLCSTPITCCLAIVAWCLCPAVKTVMEA